ncbi:MAG: NADH-ubiquinone oxidoreductase chain J, partial [uncultured Sphingomonas sp.]
DRPFRLLPVCDRDHRLGGAGDLCAQPGALGAVADPGLLQRGWPDVADRGRVHRDAAGDRLRRRRRGAVPVRGHDAGHRLLHLARRRHPQSSVRAADRDRAAGRDRDCSQRARRGAGGAGSGHGRKNRSRAEHRGPGNAALQPLPDHIRIGRPDPADRGRVHRDAAGDRLRR